jgi:hypothetical protein
MSNQFLNEREHDESFDVSKKLITEMMKSLHLHCIERGFEMEDVSDNVTAEFLKLFMTIAQETQHLHGQHRLVGDIENLIEEYNLNKLIY